jgi:hypothetical protein
MDLRTQCEDIVGMKIEIYKHHRDDDHPKYLEHKEKYSIEDGKPTFYQAIVPFESEQYRGTVGYGPTKELALEQLLGKLKQS